VALVEEILAAKKSPPAPLCKGGENDAPHFMKGGQAEGRGDLPLDIPALEAEIDRLVYALCALTDEGIAVVEQRKRNDFYGVSVVPCLGTTESRLEYIL
jgi:hypothetical protein